MRSLCSSECGLYEAANILLGDHLYEKSDAVQWVQQCRETRKKEGQDKRILRVGKDG